MNNILIFPTIEKTQSSTQKEGTLLKLNTSFKKPEKKAKKESQFSIMEKIAKEANLNYEGGNSTLYYDEGQLNIYVSDMSKTDYSKLVKKLNKFSIKTQHYEVYAAYDVSSYNYWASLQDEANYIQISVKIINPEKVNTKKLTADVLKAYSKFHHYDNTEYHNFSSISDLENF